MYVLYLVQERCHITTTERRSGAGHEVNFAYLITLTAYWSGARQVEETVTHPATESVRQQAMTAAMSLTLSARKRERERERMSGQM